MITDAPEQATDVVRVALECNAWSIGLGVGHVENPRPPSVREISGQGVDAAMDALTGARTESGVPVCVRAADARHEQTAADVEALLRLTGWIIATRNAGQWRTVRAMRRNPRATQAVIAEELGVTQQTVSRALKTSGWREESSAYPLAHRMLAMMDLTSGVPAERLGFGRRHTGGRRARRPS